MYLSENKNPIIYGSFTGLFEHFVGVAPRTILDFKQYYNNPTKHLSDINLKKLYKGTVPYLSGVCFGHMSLFYFLEQSKKQKNSLMDGLYGFIGKCSHDLFIVPGDTVRMRSNLKQISNKQSFTEIYNKYGVKGFFKGLGPAYSIGLLSGAIEFTTMMYLERKYGSDGLKPFLYGGITGICSSVITSPIDTIKTQIQMDQNIKYSELIKKIYDERGMKGFFRGMFLRSFQCVLSYGTYEYLSHNLNLD